MTVQPLTDDQLAAIQARFERTTHPDWRADTDTGQLLAEVQQNRERLAAIAQLASALMDCLPGDDWFLAHAIEQCARGEITPAEALEDDQ